MKQKHETHHYTYFPLIFPSILPLHTVFNQKFRIAWQFFVCRLQNKIPINYFSLHDKNTRFITLLPLGHWFNFVQLLALRKNTELYHVGETLVFHLDNALFIQRGLSTAQRGIELELSESNYTPTPVYYAWGLHAGAWGRLPPPQKNWPCMKQNSYKFACRRYKKLP